MKLYEIDALDKFHDQVMRAVLFAVVEERDDVFVGQAGGGLGLAVEAFDHHRLGGHVRGQHLESHRPAQLGVDGLVDRPHAAGGNVVDDLVFSQPARMGLGWLDWRMAWSGLKAHSWGRLATGQYRDRLQTGPTGHWTTIVDYTAYSISPLGSASTDACLQLRRQPVRILRI